LVAGIGFGIGIGVRLVRDARSRLPVDPAG
jgi:hypothetical protein